MCVYIWRPILNSILLCFSPDASYCFCTEGSTAACLCPSLLSLSVAGAENSHKNECISLNIGHFVKRIQKLRDVLYSSSFSWNKLSEKGEETSQKKVTSQSILWLVKVLCCHRLPSGPVACCRSVHRWRRRQQLQGCLSPAAQKHTGGSGVLKPPHGFNCQWW